MKRKAVSFIIGAAIYTPTRGRLRSSAVESSASRDNYRDKSVIFICNELRVSDGGGSLFTRSSG